MHDGYDHRGFHRPELEGPIPGLHVHDSIVVLEKAANIPPAHSRVG